MNSVVNEQGVFQLKDLVSCGDRKVIHKSLIENNKVRFPVISLAPGAELQEHPAPMDALLFALDGEAVFTHEGKDYVFKAGNNFSMKKGGPPSYQSYHELQVCPAPDGTGGVSGPQGFRGHTGGGLCTGPLGGRLCRSSPACWSADWRFIYYS